MRHLDGLERHARDRIVAEVARHILARSKNFVFSHFIFFV
jgi:hypothetical protein